MYITFYSICFMCNQLLKIVSLNARHCNWLLEMLVLYQLFFIMVRYNIHLSWFVLSLYLTRVSNQFI